MNETDKLRAVNWYSSNPAVNLVYAVPPIALWYYYFMAINHQELFWPVAGAMGLAYWFVRRKMRRFCYEITVTNSKTFSQSPRLMESTSEYQLDSFDSEILQRLDEAREEKRTDYLSLLADLSDTIEPEELFRRLGKLRALSCVRTTPIRVSLLPRGMDYVLAPQIFRLSRIPQKYGAALAKARIDLDNQNYNGVTDDIHALFEAMLRDALTKKYGADLENEWKRLQKEGKVRPDYAKASLGYLLRASKELGIITGDSANYMWISSFIALRNPQKHAGVDTVEEEYSGTSTYEIARSSLSLGEMFVRHWF